jgi:hypothetical protein
VGLFRISLGIEALLDLLSVDHINFLLRPVRSADEPEDE